MKSYIDVDHVQHYEIETKAHLAGLVVKSKDGAASITVSLERVAFTSLEAGLLMNQAGCRLAITIAWQIVQSDFLQDPDELIRMADTARNIESNEKGERFS